MMGDNRDNSTDSRVLSAVGYVPFENLVGRAQIIFFSIAEGEHAWTVLELAGLRCAGTGCSPSCDDDDTPVIQTQIGDEPAARRCAASCAEEEAGRARRRRR